MRSGRAATCAAQSGPVGQQRTTCGAQSVVSVAPAGSDKDGAALRQRPRALLRHAAARAHIDGYNHVGEREDQAVPAAIVCAEAVIVEAEGRDGQVAFREKDGVANTGRRERGRSNSGRGLLAVLYRRRRG